MKRAHWDFEYRLVSPRYEPTTSATDMVVALRGPLDTGRLRACLRTTSEPLSIEVLVERAPLHWYRLQFAHPEKLTDVEATLRRHGVAPRYVTSSTLGNLALGERLRWDAARPASAATWATRARRAHPETNSDGRWLFHERGGIDVDRAVCGTAAGTRLAVIDDEAMESDALELDAEVLVGTLAPSRSSLHGSLMAAWAVGVRGDGEKGVQGFTGIAPDASPRLYLIPKPGRDLVMLPTAIVRAVDDGADVVVCATHTDAATTPLLDDALAFASRLGRGGKGTAVVMPTGREISSPPGSLHASLTLPLGDPASDPRVLCVAPSGRDGGWFTWKDKRGRLRPFANRGPSVRVAAPGDDMAYPFAKRERLGHAESSGAAAIAAGAALLVLATNPELTVAELYSVLSATASREAVVALEGSVADAADFLPEGRDRDGHEARCGYGRLAAARACMAVADPLAAVLVAMGDDEAARVHLAGPSLEKRACVQCSIELRHLAARALLQDAELLHQLKVIVRHFRLCGADETRSQPPEATARFLALVAERLLTQAAPDPAGIELARLHQLAVEASRGGAAAQAVETWCFEMVSWLFRSENGPRR